MNSEDQNENRQQKEDFIPVEKLAAAFNCSWTFKLICMHKVIFKAILVTDSETLTKMQQTINQWITIGKLKKYKTSTAGEYIFFELCVLKDKAE